MLLGMGVIACKNFNLAHTLASGQFFRYEQRDDWTYAVTRNRVFRVRQEGSRLFYDGASAQFVRTFFGLVEDYAAIQKRLRTDRVLAAAMRQYPGLRIMKQDAWECTLAFLCSQFSNIKKIKRNLELIARRFGEPVTFRGFSTFTTPGPERITDLDALKKCALGYRAPYVLGTSRRVNDQYFAWLRTLSYEQAKEELLALPGIGEKVADCILLFSLGFTEAFPVDVWMERVLREHYVTEKLSLPKLALFGRQRWGTLAGYAQQYLYHSRRLQ